MTTVDKDAMLDVGKHCCVCRRLDFLPYTCPKCSLSFCSEHRMQFNEHKCVVDQNRKQNEHAHVATKHLPPSSSFFPDLDKLRNEANVKASSKNGRFATHDNRLGGSADNSALNTAEIALRRLKKLLGKKTKAGRGLFGSAFKKNGFKTSSTSKMVELARLKKAAKGDAKISSAQRVYVRCIYIPEDATSVGKEGVALFVSKTWPVGRMLDSCTELMKVRNVNNRVVDKEQKLTLFRGKRTGEDGDEFVHVPVNGRVNKEIKDGDEVYIVRGTSSSVVN